MISTPFMLNAARTAQPVSRIRVFLRAAFCSMNWIVIPAMSFSAAFSMPWSPGEEFISMTTGPLYPFVRPKQTMRREHHFQIQIARRTASYP